MAQSSTSGQSDRNDLSDNDGILDGRNRAIVIGESLARAIAAIRTTSVRWRPYLPLKHGQKVVLIAPWVRVAAIRIARLGFHGMNVTCNSVPCGMAEWLARLTASTEN